MKRHEEDLPLDAEERALAAQLRRLPPHGEPAPDLDARILAMARTANGGRRPAPWYRSLPGYASAAAVCVLAAGLAWQLWPAHVQRTERVATPAPVPPPPAPAKPVAEVLPASQETATAAQDSVADKVDAAPPPREVIAPPQPPRPAPKVSVPPTPQPPIVSSTDETSAYSAPEPAVAARVMAPPAPPPAPPAPPAPPPQTVAPAAAAEGGVKSREQQKTAAPAMNAMRAKTADNTENGYDARPPATVQDTSVRNDWLKRIRELMAQGDRDGARSSLQEYRTRYPDATIPSDLQPLLAPPPTKTP